MVAWLTCGTTLVASTMHGEYSFDTVALAAILSPLILAQGRS